MLFTMAIKVYRKLKQKYHVIYHAHEDKICSPSFRTTDEFINCKIIASPGKYDFKPLAFGYQKNSPFAEIFDYYIEKMRQTGHLDAIKSKYQGLEQNCPDLRLVIELFYNSFQLGCTAWGGNLCEKFYNIFSSSFLENSSLFPGQRSCCSRAQLLMELKENIKQKLSHKLLVQFLTKKLANISNFVSS